MKLKTIASEIYNIIRSRYEIESNIDLKNEFMSLANEKLKNKEILRIRRLGIQKDNWKTLVLIEIEAINEIDIKVEFRYAINWVAEVKQSLLGTESSDIYLFLVFNGEITLEECLRIESTEQFCRKYVLLPNEEPSDFVNRTFLQKFITSEDSAESTDPLERAFINTLAQFSWLTPEVQKRWKKAFSEWSGSELFDQLLQGRGNI